MNDLVEIYNRLYAAYGTQQWWPARTPYEMMVGAILTQNTAWSNVEKALLQMGENLNPEYVLAAEPEVLAAQIRSSGYHNQKALRLKSLTEWYGEYGYDIHRVREADGEELRRQLLAIKGIGGETADSILTYALDKPFFVVDAYTRRILQRYGYDLPKAYDGLREMIESAVPRTLYVYNEFHALIVRHAKMHCTVKPRCEGCPLEGRCQKRIL